MDLKFVDDESWKCRRHPSQPRDGICPICLRDRLLLLCPECAVVRPCACYNCPPDFLPSPSPSSSSLSSKSSSSTTAVAVAVSTASTSVGAVGRISSLIDAEPPLQRSRSTALHFLRSRTVTRSEPFQPPHPEKSGRSFLRWMAGAEKPKRKVEDAKQMPRSRSIGVGSYSDAGDVAGGEVKMKGRGWHFPSPIKAFRQPRTVKLVQERSPLYRG